MDTYTGSFNDQEHYEVFRRAIVERDSQAWTDVAIWCRPLLIAWARQKLARMPIVELYDDIADEAFARAWSALASTSLDRFPNLAAIQAYLRKCVVSVVIDRMRIQSESVSSLTWIDPVSDHSAEQMVLTELNRAEIWAQINRHIVSEQERIVMYESIVLGLPPRAILRNHPTLFDDITSIYRVKRNLFDRLRRDNNLRRLYGG